ncbi:MAG: hypothetical protein Q3979_01685 [Actinomycetaceae bacterium]|nr:hypothetical protein [Actinomycetaceae bacterium]
MLRRGRELLDRLKAADRAVVLYRCGLVGLVLVLGASGLFLRSLLSPDAPDGPFTSVVVGQHHTCATSDKGSVYCWGSQAQGQVGSHNGKVGRIEVQTYPARVDVPGSATALSAGARHTCALNTKGELYCWGANDAGQSGRPKAKVVWQPSKIPVRDVTSVSAGESHTCATTKRGAVYCWGDNGKGQVKTSELDWLSAPEEHYARPQEVELPGKAVDVAAGQSESCALMDDSGLVCWSAAYVEPMPSSSELYVGTGKVLWSRYVPGKIESIASGGDPDKGASLCAQTASKTVFCWASGLGDGDRFDIDEPGVARMFTGEVQASADIAGRNGYLKASKGHLAHVPVQEALNSAGRTKKTFVQKEPKIFRVPGRAVAVSSGYSYEHGCAINDSGAAYCWGHNEFGQLGNGMVVAEKDDEYASTLFPVRVGP